MHLLEVRSLTKVFPGVVAVDNVDLDIAPGEIVALLGQNGAGKSTLIQVLSGLYPFGTYSGDIIFAGAPLRCRSVADAEAAGVAFLAQEVNVAPDLTVAEGLFLNNEPSRFGLVDAQFRMARAKLALKNFGVDIDPALPLGDLDLATQQLVLIVRALSKNARLLILDEPTAALTDRETVRLFERMRALSARGVAIIFVSHRLAEVFEISNRIVIMRDGRISGAFRTSETSRDAVVDQMIGATPTHRHANRKPRTGGTALEAHDLSVFDASGREVANRLALAIGRGEILGLFGLLGSGVNEATMALFGAWRGAVSGSISIDGVPAKIASPVDAVGHGVGLIAQDRRDGLSGEHSIYDNAILANLDELSRYGFVDAVKARRKVMDLFDRLKIKAGDVDMTVGTLSGGNQQKVQVVRWLAAGAKILLLIDPTRGVDVGARAEIKRIWTELADAGCAILLVSSDAEEIVEICDRAVVLCNGRIAGTIDGADLSETRLLKLAAGV
ncbi:sugar ABC transporter ATP-binding protein [Mesorhizobium sp. CN2-181]|uniref:sugar ABC transporter ATP-binding protein n=1 Tax=Mesorhizobium yinganensis TaxID=3157707 RepID=UPI0032B83949